MGANPEQTLKALREAESYDGPSLIIAYAPCINHGIKAGMNKSMLEMKKAVRSGYWDLLRYNPALAAEGKNPLVIDSKEPTADYIELIESETRYSRLLQQFPDRAKVLFGEASDLAKAKYDRLVKLSHLYD